MAELGIKHRTLVPQRRTMRLARECIPYPRGLIVRCDTISFPSPLNATVLTPFSCCRTIRASHDRGLCAGSAPIRRRQLVDRVDVFAPG
jgi:hypothetical protein